MVDVFTCTNCSFKTKYSTSFRRHILIHSNEKQHKCSVDGCSYTTYRNDALIRHRKAHENEDTFTCTYPGCSYKVHRTDTLKRHAMTHTGVKNIKCMVENCGYATSRKDSLSVHTKVIHTEEGRQRQKREEERIAKALTAAGISFKREHRIEFDCIGRTWCFIDFVIISNGVVIFLEVDEFQHIAYGVSCEVRRMTDVHAACMLDGNTLPIHFIRYNPDRCRRGSTCLHINKHARESKIIDLVRDILSAPTERQLSIYYMFYDMNEDGTLAIHSDPDYPESIKEACVRESQN
jgi:hypothetical protein